MGSSPTAPTTRVMNTYARLPLEIVKGKGAWIQDLKGNNYLDAVAGIATCTLGHSDRVMNWYLNKQLNKIQHTSNLYQVPEQEALAAWITTHSCFDKVFFCNSGAEANEAAIKLARKHAHQVRGIERPVILTAEAGFHGRTLATISATGQSKYHRGFEPMVNGFRFFAYNNISSFNSLLAATESEGPRVAAILIEPLQGEGGVNPGDVVFFKHLRECCDAYNILLIFDEVQTGVGRSGELWGYNKLGIEPDAFTLAKGLGGGIPIGALAIKQKHDLLCPGDHASTFGGNPFACRAGLTVMKELERRNLTHHAKRMGRLLQELLTELVKSYPEHLEGLRGWGLLQGLILKKGGLTAPVLVKQAMLEKLLIVPAGLEVVRFLPPLTIKPCELREAVRRLERAIQLLLD
uniref:acetylornithine transaminase n=1 Tax=Paulinella chromatophora TaxID=39717 RepID=B1X3M5_PAUCH|nr:acetylornithine aminotransferase [Paulinella chromatophora]ACB42544.1 acetylornithine aminotransferase [Paulinella chromatophora]